MLAGKQDRTTGKWFLFRVCIYNVESLIRDTYQRHIKDDVVRPRNVLEKRPSKNLEKCARNNLKQHWTRVTIQVVSTWFSRTFSRTFFQDVSRSYNVIFDMTLISIFRRSQYLVLLQLMKKSVRKLMRLMQLCEI